MSRRGGYVEEEKPRRGQKQQEGDDMGRRNNMIGSGIETTAEAVTSGTATEYKSFRNRRLQEAAAAASCIQHL